MVAVEACGHGVEQQELRKLPPWGARHESVKKVLCRRPRCADTVQRIFRTADLDDRRLLRAHAGAAFGLHLLKSAMIKRRKALKGRIRRLLAVSPDFLSEC